MNNISRHIVCIATVCLLVGLFVLSPALALEHVTLQRSGQDVKADGRLLVEAQDGGLMILARDGVIWTVEPEELRSRTSDDKSFKPLGREELIKKMLAELPPGFDVHRTTNYLVFFNTSRDYAQWCGSLFERLYRAFNTYWTRKGFSLREPEFPLIAVVFADKASYTKFAQAELGNAADSIIGYYSLQTNRMVMYDLTGMGRLDNGRTATTTATINRVLSRPAAAQTTATIVHEATHQIAFNRGLHARYSDCPLWVCEGIAMLHETPDLKSRKGWRKIDAVNTLRLARFRSYQTRRASDSLRRLIESDERFRNTATSRDAYAEAWALTYFLLHQRPKQYIEYLKRLSTKRPLMWDTPDERLRMVEHIFGDPEKLDAELLRYMNRVGP